MTDAQILRAAAQIIHDRSQRRKSLACRVLVGLLRDLANDIENKP